MGIIEDKILVLLSDVISNVLFEQIPEFLFCLIMALCYTLLLVLCTDVLYLSTSIIMTVCGIIFNKFDKNNISKVCFIIGIMIFISGAILDINNWINQLIITTMD